MGLYEVIWGYTGKMEKRQETTIMGLYKVLGFGFLKVGIPL